MSDMTTQDNKLNQRKEKIIEYLRINRSHHGEVHVSEMHVPRSIIHADISPERERLLRDSLVQFEGNILPIIVRHLKNPIEPKRYEVIYGAEICQVAQAFVREVGEETANQLKISRLRVWLMEAEDQDVQDIRQNMETIAQRIVIVEKEPEEIIEDSIEEDISPEADIIHISGQSDDIEPTEEEMPEEDIYAEIETCLKASDKKALAQILEVSDLNRSALYRIVMMHSPLQQIARENRISLTSNTKKKALLQILRLYCQ